MELGVLTKLLIAIRILESYKVGYAITEYTQKKNLIVFFQRPILFTFLSKSMQRKKKWAIEESNIMPWHTIRTFREKTFIIILACFFRGIELSTAYSWIVLYVQVAIKARTYVALHACMTLAQFRHWYIGPFTKDFDQTSLRRPSFPVHFNK